MILKNAKWEAFAQGIALRKCSATRAYLEAGYRSTEQAASVSAHHLLKNPKVTQRIEELGGEVAERAVEAATLDREERIARLENRAREMDRIVESRAADPSMAAVPGGRTGLLVRSYRAVGKQLAEEFAVDTGLLKELRATEQQCAIERGEWLTKTAVELRTDLPVMDVPEDASIEQIREAKRRMQDAIDVLKSSAPKPRVQ